MSEELLQTIPQKIGIYTYYKLGSTTLNQLKSSGIIPKKNYGKLSNKKPDGLVIYHNSVKAVIEYKLPEKLKTDKDIEKAIKQEIQVAKSLCKILIVTDGSKSIWVNSLTGDLIKDSKENTINTVFNPLLVKNIDNVEYLISSIDASITKNTSVIQSAKLVDPSPLAARLWQTIWVATGKSPVKCLYNVVELFIFKFLSDLEILEEDISFNYIYNKSLSSPEDALGFYARNTRHRIRTLFPEGDDGTTIINGTIFVNEDGEANLSQSILFRRSLEHLKKYGEEFGSLTKIDKQFKTKLYESFLNQEVEALGQYFTPRKIVQTIIRISGLDDISNKLDGIRICDPFCGVGGFPLELLNMNESMKAHYIPDRENKIKLPFTLHGFDKGFERDDERTIILAKANMLIYLSELLFTSPKLSNEFSKIFNSTFRLFKDNLGTFGHIIKNENKKYDFILSNPPYVTSGSSIIKEELYSTERTKNEYPINALGLEGISIEWIIRSLKKGGKSFIVIPDGILSRVGGAKLREYILRECYLDAVISLPIRTFFANFKQTYIIAITKKHKIEDVQETPVFTYLVSNIGEKLTSVKRNEIDDNDLPELETLYGVFVGAKKTTKEILENQSQRCKIQPIEYFQSSSHWIIDRWWSRTDKVTLGIEESFQAVTIDELNTVMSSLKDSIQEYDDYIDNNTVKIESYKEVSLGNKDLFSIFIGKRIKKEELPNIQGDIPAYSANVFDPFGFINHTRIDDFSKPSIIWSIDGNFNFNLLPINKEFATTDHCGTIQIIDENIIPEFLLYALNLQKIEESFDRSFRASLTNMRKFSIKIPTTNDGNFDTKLQTKIADFYLEAEERKKNIELSKAELDKNVSNYVASNLLQ